MGSTEEKKPDGGIIHDSFYELRLYVGTTLKLINDVIHNIGDPADLDGRLDDMVLLITEDALDHFNQIMTEIADKFEDLEFEPLILERDRIEKLGTAGKDPS